MNYYFEVGKENITVTQEIIALKGLRNRLSILKKKLAKFFKDVFSYLFQTPPFSAILRFIFAL